MIKSFFRFSFLVFFVLVSRLNIYADDNTLLLQGINDKLFTIADFLSSTQNGDGFYIWDEFASDYIDFMSGLEYGEIFLTTKDLELFDLLQYVPESINSILGEIQDSIVPALDEYTRLMQGHAYVLDHLYDLPEINTSIGDNIISLMSLLDLFSNKFTFDNGDLNVYDQRVAGLIQELKEQTANNHDAESQQRNEFGASLANHFKELEETIRDSSSSAAPPDNFLTQAQLEESYDKFLIPNFYKSFHESKAISFADYISWTDPTALDYKEDSSFDIKVEHPQENSDGDFFQVLSGYLSNLATLHANNSRSLVLMTKIMKGEDHKEEEDEIKNDINEYLGRDQEIQQAMDELLSTLQDSYTTQKTSRLFDLSTLDSIATVSLPNEINLGSLPLSNIFGIDLREFINFYLDISFFHPMIEVSRSVFSIILFLFLGSIAIFIYRLSAPFIFRIIDLLKSAFANW